MSLLAKGGKNVLKQTEENTKLCNTLNVLHKVKMSFLEDTNKSPLFLTRIPRQSTNIKLRSSLICAEI